MITLNITHTLIIDNTQLLGGANTDESTDALEQMLQATIDFINENILNNVEATPSGQGAGAERRSQSRTGCRQRSGCSTAMS